MKTFKFYSILLLFVLCFNSSYACDLLDIEFGENKSSLENIFNEIDEFEKSEIKENRFKNTVDFYQYYLLWGIIFFLTFILSKSTFVNNILKD